MNEIEISEDNVLPHDHELIAQAMLFCRGNLASASRLDSIEHNAMSLRRIVKENPEIRNRYMVLLSEEMQEKGLHIAERILKMAELQETAYGSTITHDAEGNELAIPLEVPADPKTVIELSKEISRLIAEGKKTPFSTKEANSIAGREDGEELLLSFLDS